MRYLLSILFTILIFSATAYAEEVSLNEFQNKVGVIHSHAWFKGFYYLGSDDKFHYFTEEWDYRVDPEYKIAKDKIKLAVGFSLGEKKLGFSPIEGYGYKVFFVTAGKKYFRWE